MRLSEGCCPFCGERLVEGTAPAAAGWAVGLALLGAACGPGLPQEGSAGEGSSGGGDTGSSGGAGVTGEVSAGTTTTASSATTGAPHMCTSTSGDEPSGCPETGCPDVGEGGAFIYGAPDPTPGECDPWVQDCPEGQKCAPVTTAGWDGGSNFLQCVPVAQETVTVGELCVAEDPKMGLDNCEPGSICWSVDPVTMEGVCVQQCGGTPGDPQCPDGTGCLNANNGVLTLCLPPCNPLLKDCPDGEVCTPDPQSPDRFFCVVDASGDEGQQWDACEFSNACDPGLVCANAELGMECSPNSAGCCLPFCDLTQPSCDGVGQECLPWYADCPPPGLENVGVCGIPL